MKTAFVFPGQGSQYVGMGKELYDNFSEVREVYREACETLGYDVAELSFNGPEEELNKTFKTQPCILTLSFATFRVLSLKGIEPFCVAGHSLGEYSALVAAGVIPFKEAVKLTEKRGQYMQEAVPEGRGLMAAIIGMDRNGVIEICQSIDNGYVTPANFNCPGQIVISGEREAVQKAVEIASRRGAKRAVTLTVSVPSHCKLMEEASHRLSELLKDIEFNPPRMPVVNNADAAFLTNPEEIRQSLLRQLHSPLLWEDSVKNMVQKGVKVFVEVGPRTVLSGLIRRIDGDVRTLNVENIRTLTETLNVLA